MKKQIFLLSKNKAFLSIFLLCILVLFACALYYQQKAKNKDNYITHSINKYNDTKDILKAIEDIKKSINELDKTDKYYEDELRFLEETILIYNYLYDHEIKYGEFAETTALYGYTTNSLVFMSFIVGCILFLIIIIALVLSALLINHDFNSGIYKFVYGRSDKRIDIIKNKFYVYIIGVFFSFALFTLLMFILKKPYNSDFKYVIVFTQNQVKAFPLNTYKLYFIASAFITVVFYSLLYFANALLFNHLLKALSANILITVLIQGVFLGVDQKLLNTFAQFPIYYYDLNISKIYFLSIIIVKYLLLIGFFYGCVKNFVKKDLL